MGDWQQLVQSIVLGIIFSFLVAKLISIVLSFKEDNLSITRSAPRPEIPDDPNPGLAHETDSVVAEHGSVRNDSVPGSDVETDDDEDWEGVECTELDEAFSAATAFVAAAAADRLSEKVSSDAQLRLYGLYKIATEGPCSAPQPSALKVTARAKWYLCCLSIFAVLLVFCLCRLNWCSCFGCFSCGSSGFCLECDCTSLEIGNFGFSTVYLCVLFCL
jgi:acyl-CoA-binding protein